MIFRVVWACATWHAIGVRREGALRGEFIGESPVPYREKRPLGPRRSSLQQNLPSGARPAASAFRPLSWLSDNASHRSLAFEMRGGAIPQPAQGQFRSPPPRYAVWAVRASLHHAQRQHRATHRHATHRQRHHRTAQHRATILEAGESIPPRQEGKLSRECLISILPRLISRTRQ